MERDETEQTTDEASEDALQVLMAELLRAIEAEPVPPQILELAHRVARALAREAGAEPVALPSRADHRD